MNFKNLTEKYNLKVSGIIQLGAHYWQERDMFLRMGIRNFVLIEPQKEAFSKTAEQCQTSNPRIHPVMFNCAVSDTDGYMEMNCSNNNGQSSSILKPKEHIIKVPNIKFTHIERVMVHCLDNLEFDRTLYNCIYSDLQGNELQAFRGAINTLRHIDIIYTEVNFIELYEGCCLISQLDDFLQEQGFKRTYTDPDKGGWSDALYLRV